MLHEEKLLLSGLCGVVGYFWGVVSVWCWCVYELVFVGCLWVFLAFYFGDTSLWLYCGCCVGVCFIMCRSFGHVLVMRDCAITC